MGRDAKPGVWEPLGEHGEAQTGSLPRWPEGLQLRSTGEEDTRDEQRFQAWDYNDVADGWSERELFSGFCFVLFLFLRYVILIN